uniref:Cadherin domain-containing protein n=1 Tax=Macrostomum lignano TaxID=282301 RepID=A0A1I8I8M7_9PLAT
MTSALSYEFIPGMTNRSEGRFRVVPDLGYVVTKLNDGYPPAPKHYELGVRAVNNDSATPLTKYGYAFVRVYTTYQNPQFSQDSYTFYLYEESAGIGQVLCMSINNIWSTVTLSSKMGPDFNGVFSMSTNGVVSSLTRLDYDLPFAQKVWYFTAVCTENATDPSPRSSEVEVVIRLLDINDNRPYFQLPYYVKPTTTPESLAVNSEVYRVPGFDLDSAPNALLTYTLTGTNSAWFNVSTDPVTREAIIYVQSSDPHRPIRHLGLRRRLNRSITAEPSATVFIPLQNSNDNAPQMRNFTASVQRKSTAGVIIIQLQAQDIDGSGVNYYFWTGAASAQYPSAGNPQLVIDEKTGIVTVGSATLSSATDARYEIPIRAIDDGSCDGCPPGATTPLRSEIGYLTLTVVDSNNVAPVFTNCPTTNPEFTEQSPVDTPREHKGRHSICNRVQHAHLGPEDYFKVNATTGTISSNSVIDIEQIPMVTLKNYFWLTVRATNIFNGLSSYCTFQVNFIDINDEPPVFDQDEFFTRVIDSSLPSGSFVGEISAYDPDVPNTQMSTVQYFIVSSTPGASLYNLFEQQLGHYSNQQHPIRILRQNHIYSHNRSQESSSFDWHNKDVE